MNFYPFHIGDYISHTSHLSDAEDLAYRRMIDLYYMNEKPFPHDLQNLARKVKSSPDIVDLILNEFFEFNEEDQLWHNSRADKEIAKYQFVKESGKKGAEKRWGNKDLKPLELVPNSPPIATPLATKTITKTITKNNKNNIAKPEGLTDLLWNDFLILRKSKKLPVTQTAFDGIAREAKKANKTLAEVIQICCERGWGGFKESWLQQDALGIVKNKELPLGTNEQIEYAYRTECGGDPSRARFGSYQEMRKFVQDFRDKKLKNGQI